MHRSQHRGLRDHCQTHAHHRHDLAVSRSGSFSVCLVINSREAYRAGWSQGLSEEELASPWPVSGGSSTSRFGDDDEDGSIDEEPVNV